MLVMTAAVKANYRSFLVGAILEAWRACMAGGKGVGTDEHQALG